MVGMGICGRTAGEFFGYTLAWTRWHIVFIVPCQGQAAIESAGHVGGDVILLSQGLLEVVGIRAIGILDAKVIDD